MAVDNATHSFGTKVRTATWDAGTPETPPADGTFAEFGDLVDLTLPKSQVTKMKATKLNQANRWHRKKPGFIEPGDLTFRIQFIKANYNTLLGYVDAGTELWWSVDIPDSDSASQFSNLKFHGFVSGLGGEVPEDDFISVDVEICVNGKPQFTQAA
jgi:hypothetical protein